MVTIFPQIEVIKQDISCKRAHRKYMFGKKENTYEFMSCIMVNSEYYLDVSQN